MIKQIVVLSDSDYVSLEKELGTKVAYVDTYLEGHGVRGFFEWNETKGLPNERDVCQVFVPIMCLNSVFSDMAHKAIADL